MTPDGLQYTAEHEWLRSTDGDRIRVGITDFAQRSLGDIVFVQLPDIGAQATAGEPIAEVESTKSVSEIYAPAGGVVSARNEALDASPELVNSDPYGDGWLFELTVDAAIDPAHFLDSGRYQTHIAEQ